MELLGPTLISSMEFGSISTEAALRGKVVALVFGAHWIPQCRAFTLKLAEWYKTTLRAKGLEVVLISSDRDEGSFVQFFAGQPWFALPFDQHERKQRLSKRFKVQDLPALVILDAEGKTITLDGREAVAEDPTGEAFPWKPPCAREVLSGARLLSSRGEEVSLEAALSGKRAVGLYFSAHWCAPCRSFTPKLAQWYSESLQHNGLEVIVVSWDRDEEAFRQDFATMPWLAVDFTNNKLRRQLSTAVRVNAIPSLVILDPALNLITTEGREAVRADPRGEQMPWHPGPVRDLADGPGPINEVPSVIALCETSSAAQQDLLESALAPLGQQFLHQQQTAGELEPELCFFIAKTPGGLAGRIRSMLGLPTMPPVRHPHPLTRQESGSGWGCDGCGLSGDMVADRFTCTQGCDFDLCDSCNARAGDVESHPPRLVLVDVPDDNAFYLGPEGAITTELAAQFVRDCAAGQVARRHFVG